MSKRSSPAGYTPAVDVGPLCAALRQMLRGSARSLGQWRVRIFERKFGTDFLAGVPRESGIYRMYDAAGGLLYVGKARNLRRRLAQYRTARRTKKDRKRRVLVRSADRIEWQVCASELEASLTEIGLIQALRPRRNVAGAFRSYTPSSGSRSMAPTRVSA